DERVPGKFGPAARAFPTSAERAERRGRRREAGDGLGGRPGGGPRPGERAGRQGFEREAGRRAGGGGVRLGGSGLERLPGHNGRRGAGRRGWAKPFGDQL
ncbi:MAG: hypothetical protein AVDCRST_MAG58-3557, partial [uncultured Rubrobacteraceae bacterium]